jgi:ubiquinone/menaquinone biosynthesis C-methylase UbiE
VEDIQSAREEAGLAEKESKQKLSLLEARGAAQKLAFAPIVFQAVRTMWKRGILQRLADAGQGGISVKGVMAATNMSEYAVKVLLDMGESVEVVTRTDTGFEITTLGIMFLRDKMTQINMNFMHDTCYKAAFFLEESLVTGSPVGLQVFGNHKTVYEGLSKLPDDARESWFAFDHYYSDQVFPRALDKVLENQPKTLLDIGGNTGRFARSCVRKNPDIEVTIVDLPGQLDAARKEVKADGLEERIHFHETNILNETPNLPYPIDAIWMSQFLDCFSKEEIISILKRTAKLLKPGGRIYIMELFPDLQAYEAAGYSLNATSLYFSFLANGNSRMYRSEDFFQYIEDAGLEVETSFNDIGGYHTLLTVKQSV